MHRFDRDIRAIRELIAERKGSKRREDYPDGIERDAYDIYRFHEVQRELGIAGEDEEPFTYEEILADLRESGYPEI